MARLHAPWQQVARLLHGPCDAIFSNEEVSASSILLRRLHVGRGITEGVAQLSNTPSAVRLGK